MHSVLALLHLVRGAVAPQTESSRNALQHTGAAIAHIRKLISERGDWSDDAVILSVVCLASFAVCFRFETARVVPDVTTNTDI